MRKFTKTLLTLMLLVLAVGGAKAGVQTIVKSFDYTTNPVKQDGVGYYTTGYPFYFDAGWISASSTAPTLNAGSLELKNATTDSYQAFILDWATVKKGYGYKAKITYKSTAAGDVNFTFGTWSNTLNKDGVAIEATDAWKTLLVDLGTANFEASEAAHLFWKFSFAGTINIKKVEIIGEAPELITITEVEKYEAPAGTSDINGLSRTEPAYTWSVTYPKEMGPGVGWCGDIDSNNKAVDISTYKYLHFVVTNVEEGKKVSLRVFVWNGSARVCLYPYPIAEVNESTNYEAVSYITAPGTYVVKIQGNPLLRGFKGGNGWGGDDSNGKAIISQAYVSSGSDPVAYTPTGKTTVSGTEYLSDRNITCFDATALITAGQTLNATNPNALFIAKEGILTNANNVIIDGICDKLVLTDGDYPFKAPADFTATTATYTRNLGSAGSATLCLPFAATIPGDVTAYRLNYTAGNAKAKATEVDEGYIPANQPVLLSGTGEKTFSGSSVSIVANAANEQDALTGVFQPTFVPKNSYVLQDGTNGVGFYKVETDDIIANPFRAYLTADGAGARSIEIDYEVTGVNEVKVNKAVAKTGKIYNLNGQIVSKPTKGLYIIDGKVVSF